jgi:hypothetical protein
VSTTRWKTARAEFVLLPPQPYRARGMQPRRIGGLTGSPHLAAVFLALTA